MRNEHNGRASLLTVVRGVPALKEALVAGRRRVALAGTARTAAQPTSLLEQRFRQRCAELDAPSALELGTKQSIPGRSTMHRDVVPHAREFLGTDVDEGADVDVVADVHRRSEELGRERFDVILSFSTFEHLKYPHLAAHEVMKSLKVGGLLYIQTHQCFPLHSYPHDYFRFSREALAGLFGTIMGFDVMGTDYDFRAYIYARRVPDLEREAHPAHLNTMLWGEKREPTPAEYRYEL